MQSASLLTRDDTFFGVCQGLGEDFRINPLVLRVTVAGLLFWNPPAAIGIYAGAGVIVAVSRFLVREPRVEAPQPAAAPPVEPQVARVEEQEQQLLPLAA